MEEAFAHAILHPCTDDVGAQLGPFLKKKII